jgi:hypothetical protein
MSSLGIDVPTLANMAFLDESFIDSIIDNEKEYDEIDEFDRSLISSVLHCKPEYFVDQSIQKKDILESTLNRGDDTLKSRLVKVKIQDFMNDYAFVNEVMKEVE